MSRGPGVMEGFVVAYLGAECRRGSWVPVTCLTRDYAHYRRAVLLEPWVGHSEVCDCVGRCVVVGAGEETHVRRAVRRLERKGAVVARFDAYQRKLVQGSGVWPEYRPYVRAGCRCPGGMEWQPAGAGGAVT